MNAALVSYSPRLYCHDDEGYDALKQYADLKGIIDPIDIPRAISHIHNQAKHVSKVLIYLPLIVFKL